MMKKVVYTLKNGAIADRKDFEKAYLLMTGEDVHTTDATESKFLKFLWNSFGKSIASYKSYNVDELIQNGMRVFAIKLYKEINHCTMTEAYNYIKKRRAELESATEVANDDGHT